jgi:hypothetical protein
VVKLHIAYARTAVNTPITLHVLAGAEISGGTPVLTISSGPMHGSATVSGTAIVYSPSSGFNGIDTISYQVCVGSNCQTSAVNVQVGTSSTGYAGGDVGAATATTTATSTQSTSSGGALPFTGTSDALLGLLGAACIGGGFACYRAGRDRARSALR